jgi:hypothetical protein
MDEASLSSVSSCQGGNIAKASISIGDLIFGWGEGDLIIFLDWKVVIMESCHLEISTKWQQVWLKELIVCASPSKCIWLQGFATEVHMVT